MKPKTILRRMAVVVATMMCALGANAAEAYACYTSSNTTLTFYYDSQRSSRTGTTYSLNSNDIDPGWLKDGINANVTKVVFNSSFTGARPTSTYGWFSGMKKLQSITGMSYLNTSEVTNMSLMFNSCSGLTSLDVTHFNTSKVRQMIFMFVSCSNLTSLDLSSFNTSLVNAMEYMFGECHRLQTIYVGSAWSTAAVTGSSTMFANCINLVGGKGTTYDSNHLGFDYAHIDGGPSNPGYFTDVNGPKAYACYTSSNTTLTFYYDNLSNSRTGNIYYLDTGVANPGWELDETNADVTQAVFDPSFANARPKLTYDWFYNMKNLQSITGMEYLNTSEVVNMGCMFGNCIKLTSVDVSHLNTSKVERMDRMFSSCFKLTSLDLSSFNTSKVTSMEYMFSESAGLRTIYVGNGWSTAAVTSSNNMFSNNVYLKGGKGTTFDHSNPKDKTFAHIDGGTSNPGYFTDGDAPEAYACYTEENTTLTFYYDNQRRNRTSMTYDLNSADDTPEWYYDEVFVTQAVFDPSFAGARPTSTYAWFAEMWNLQTITGMKEYLNTSEVTNMYGMFASCEQLTNLDLSSFNTSHVTDMSGMFIYCYSLQTITVGSGWSTAAVTNSEEMFEGCESLVGGQGTTYDADHVDATYAHIDGGTSNPGYFTEWKEAYACYTPSNTTLTFYYDGQRNERTETTYDLNASTASPGWLKANVTRVVFHSSFAKARPTTTYNWFDHMTSLTEISGIVYLNTSEVTNMSNMFNFCSSLTSIDLSGFNTSKVTNMSAMFNNCQGLTSLNLSSFNTSNVTRMSNMFSYCTSLRNVDLSSFNTAKVTSMFNMFGNCTGLQALDLSSFNTAKVTDMRSMFESCRNLVTIMVGSGWTTAAVSVSEAMFSLCTSLVGSQGTYYNGGNPTDKTYAHIDGGYSNPGYLTSKGDPYVVLSTDGTRLTFYCDGKRLLHSETTYNALAAPNNEWEPLAQNITNVVFDASFASARPTNTEYWFAGMDHLTSITGMEYLNTSEVKYMSVMFYGCESLTSIDLSHFDTGKVTEMYEMFVDCSSLTRLNLSSFNTSKVQLMNDMFSGCTSLRTIFVSDGWTTASTTTTGCDEMFWKCTSIVGGMGTTYDSSYVGEDAAHIDQGDDYPGYLTDVSFLTDPYAMLSTDGKTLTFYHDGQRYLYSSSNKTYSLNYPDGEEPYWYQEDDYYYLKRVVFHPSFATARPTKTREWFLEMENLETITDIKYLNTSEVTDMSDMFNDCCALTSIDVSHFDTHNVTNMSYMFYGCSELKSLDVSGFNTAEVTRMTRMFGYCSELKSLDLGSFNTSKVYNMVGMFYGCPNLQTIYVGNGWSTAAVTNSSDMFVDCSKLVGSKGTTYNASHIDKAYAHIDGGPSYPGYFTAAIGYVTNIEAAPAKIISAQGIYTLDGRKLNELPTQKGIYIIDGHKVVIK